MFNDAELFSATDLALATEDTSAGSSLPIPAEVLQVSQSVSESVSQ